MALQLSCWPLAAYVRYMLTSVLGHLALSNLWCSSTVSALLQTVCSDSVHPGGWDGEPGDGGPGDGGM